MSSTPGKYKYVWGVECPQCLSRIWSQYTHDFHHCPCGYCFVDGGRDYLRAGYGSNVKSGEVGRFGPPRSVRIRVPIAKLKQLARNDRNRFPY